MNLPTILYVGGYSRSGSTLLARILGEAPESVCVGEIRFIWSRGLIDNVECGCGQPFRSCQFWSEIAEEAFGGWKNIDARMMTDLDHQLNLFYTLPFYARKKLPARLRLKAQYYIERLSAVYEAISHVSGAQTIVDTSKDPTFACLLMRMHESDIRILHLVRDSRAVAYSWTRRRKLLSPIGGEEYMPQFSPASTAGRWLAWNGGVDSLGMTKSKYHRLTYESFIADPLGTLRELSEFAEKDLVLPEAQMNESEVELGSHHIFSGNPMREKSGRLTIRLDTEWQSKLTGGQLAAVTAISWPLLLRYGYPLVPR